MLEKITGLLDSLAAEFTEYFGCLHNVYLAHLLIYAVIGNAKSNKHWEAELPPNFDRNGYGVEKFIRSK